MLITSSNHALLELAGLSRDVVALEDTLRRGKPHRVQARGRAGKQLPNGSGKSLHVAGRHQPAGLTRQDELRNAGDEGRDNGSAQRHGFHDRHRKAFRKTRKDERVSLLQLRDDPRPGHPARDGDPVAKAKVP